MMISVNEGDKVFLNCRMINMAYVPPYVSDNGKHVKPRLYFRVMTRMGEAYKLTALNEFANIFAKFCSYGKYISLVVDKSNIVKGFMLGEDSKEEIATRPFGWNIIGHEGNLTWRNLMQKIKNMNFCNEHIESKQFGNAKVLFPEVFRKNGEMRLLRNCDKMI